MSAWEGLEFFIAECDGFEIKEPYDVELLWAGLARLCFEYPGQIPIYVLDDGT